MERTRRIRGGGGDAEVRGGAFSGRYRLAGLRHDSPREALDRPIVRQTAAAGSWRPVNAPERRIPPRTPPHDGRRSDGPGAGKRRAKRERGKSELTRRVPTCQERVLKPPSQHLTRDPSPTRVWAEVSSEAGFGGGRAAAGHGTIAGGATTAGLTCVCRARPAFRRCLSGRLRRRPGEQQLRGRLNLAGPLSPLPEAVFSGNPPRRGPSHGASRAIGSQPLRGEAGHVTCGAGRLCSSRAGTTPPIRAASRVCPATRPLPGGFSSHVAGIRQACAGWSSVYLPHRD
ncbi:hypothetical protein B2J93_5792 [Marssonina coronariae]|uniref:Uncharacterized protein n=1 Tax=Diplocarpon coronariae TaxID=2795749 RepID=A0A218YTL2_9HELO|nr:hypothetical protein B2J93_5792 [Marssonina coronariae]